MTKTPLPVSPSVDPAETSQAGSASRRRNLLRLAAGGVPLLSTGPVAANLAASSAWRAVRQDALANPDLVSSQPDGWIRVTIQIVELRLVDPTGTSVETSTSSVESTVQAYKFGDPPRYCQVGGLQLLNTLYWTEVSKVGDVYALVLFDSSGGIQGVDPGRMLGDGIQGLHCSSWRSISPNGQTFPGCAGV